MTSGTMDDVTRLVNQGVGRGDNDGIAVIARVEHGICRVNNHFGQLLAQLNAILVTDELYRTWR